MMDAQDWRDLASVCRTGAVAQVAARPALNAMADRCEGIAAEREQSQREPGSVITIGGTELRTQCGHSFATCHTDRCFRWER